MWSASARLTLALELESTQALTLETVDADGFAIVRVESLRTGVPDAIAESRTYLIEGPGELAVAFIDTIAVEGSGGLAVREIGVGERLVSQ